MHTLGNDMQAVASGTTGHPQHPQVSVWNCLLSPRVSMFIQRFRKKNGEDARVAKRVVSLVSKMGSADPGFLVSRDQRDGFDH
jgi:hypothetical protein